MASSTGHSLYNMLWGKNPKDEDNNGGCATWVTCGDGRSGFDKYVPPSKPTIAQLAPPTENRPAVARKMSASTEATSDMSNSLRVNDSSELREVPTSPRGIIVADVETSSWPYEQRAFEETTQKSSDDECDEDSKVCGGRGGGGCFMCCACWSMWQLCAIIALLILFLGVGFGAGIFVGMLEMKTDDTPDRTPTFSPQPTDQPSVSPSVSPSFSSKPSNEPTSSPSVSPSTTPTDYPTFRTIPPSNITVGVFYYPWHAEDFHNGSGYMRKLLEPKQDPLLGEYDDRMPSVIQQHLAWSRQANIRLWVSSWWGAGRQEDLTLKNVILPHRDLGDHKIALFYETSGRIKTRGDVTTQNVLPDLQYIADTYFVHPNYYRIDGRPVLFLYISRVLENIGVLEEVILLMRSVAAQRGHNIYIVGDHAFARAPSVEFFNPLVYLDAVTNYDMYGAMRATGYAGQEGVDRYFTDQTNWRQLAHQHHCAYIPSVSPGFNDRGVRFQVNHEPLARKLSPNSPSGSLFRTVVNRARWLTDSSTSFLMMVNSFNEWHEDTQIEPAVGSTTSVPFNYTLGLEYEGYGTLYLDILREETEDQPQ